MNNAKNQDRQQQIQKQMKDEANTLTNLELKILLPDKVFCEENGVQRIHVKSASGMFGILPHRLDCIVVLIPGTLTYEDNLGQRQFVAVDTGILTKIGSHVVIATRSAVNVTSKANASENFEGNFFNVIKTKERIQQATIATENRFLRTLLDMHHGKQ